MRTLYFILYSYSSIVTVLCIILVGYYVFDKVKNRNNNNNESEDKGSYKVYKIGIIIAIISTILICAPFQEIIKLSNIEFKPNGEYCFYVILENDEGLNSQTVPARIKISQSSEDVEGVYGEQRTAYFIHYNLKEVYVEGKAIQMHGELTLNNYETVEDDNGNYYVCKLINERAYFPDKAFDNGITVFSVVFLILQLSVFIAAYMIFRSSSKLPANKKTA